MHIMQFAHFFLMRRFMRRLFSKRQLINLMLKRYAEVFIFPAVYFYTSVDYSDDKACILCILLFFISCNSFQNLEFGNNTHVYSGAEQMCQGTFECIMLCTLNSFVDTKK